VAGLFVEKIQKIERAFEEFEDGLAGKRQRQASNLHDQIFQLGRDLARHAMPPRGRSQNWRTLAALEAFHLFRQARLPAAENSFQLSKQAARKLTVLCAQEAHRVDSKGVPSLEALRKADAKGERWIDALRSRGLRISNVMDGIK
jgi:hypothetical protein